MTNCPDCGTEVQRGVPFCTGCGRTLPSAAPDHAGGPAAAWLPPTLPPPVQDGAHPFAPVDTDGGERRRRARRRVRLIGSAFAVVGVGALAVVLWLWLGGSGNSGGADSPTQALSGLVDALNEEDFVAAIGYLAPDEVDGMVDLLDAIQSQATDQGMPGLTKGEGLDLSVAVSDLDESSSAKNVSLVRATVDVDVADVGAQGPLAEMVGSGRRAEFELDVVALKIGGGWYISPMLTAGTYLADVADLPEGDFDEVAAPSTSTKADSATEAVEMMAESAVEEDFDTLQAVVSSGEARFVRVFSRAISEVLDREYFAAARADARADDKGGAVILSSLGFTMSNDGMDEDITYEDACVTSSSSQTCPLDSDLGELTGLSRQDLAWSVAKQDGRYRVSVISSVAAVARKAVANLDRQSVLRALDLELLDEAQSIELDTDVELEVDATGYALFEFQAAAGTEYTWATDGESGYCWVDSYSLDDSGEWTYDWLGSGAARTARLLLECDDDSQLTFRVNTVRIEQVSLPLDERGSVGLGQTVGFEFQVAQEGFFDLSVNGPVRVQSDDYLRITDDGFVQLAAGTNRIYVVADGGGGEFSLTLAAHATPRGFAGGQLGTNVDLSAEGSTVSFYAFAGDTVTIEAQPNDLQDIVLEAVCCSEYSVDVGYSGGAETTTVTVSTTGWQEIRIFPFFTYEGYGTVDVRISFG